MIVLTQQPKGFRKMKDRWWISTNNLEITLHHRDSMSELKLPALQVHLQWQYTCRSKYCTSSLHCPLFNDLQVFKQVGVYLQVWLRITSHFHVCLPPYKPVRCWRYKGQNWHIIRIHVSAGWQQIHSPLETSWSDSSIILENFQYQLLQLWGCYKLSSWVSDRQVMCFRDKLNSCTTKILKSKSLNKQLMLPNPCMQNVYHHGGLHEETDYIWQ